VTTPTLPVHALYSHLGTAIATSLGSAWRRSGRHPESLDELVSNPETTRLWSLAVVASSWADDGAARPNGRNQRALGQTFEHHSVHPSARQNHRRIDPIPGKARTCTDDTNRRRHHKPM
jgi:hypothetical protein